MKRRGRGAGVSLAGYVIFFLTVSSTVTVALTIFGLVNRGSRGNTTVISVTMLVLILLVSGLFTAADVIRRRITVARPTRRILAATEEIAAGNFDVRLDATHSYERYDDYDLIMENLNRMAEELGKSEVLTSDFVSNVSHELKTPLAVIRSYASMLEDGTLDGETRQKYITAIKDATERLSTLVSNILRLSKLENRALPPEPEEIRLAEQLEECILAYEEPIKRKAITLDCVLAEFSVRTVPSYLELVWHNLLGNAVKFTEAGGKISVTLSARGSDAVVTVADSGCGISPEIGKHIFDKFYQGDTSHAGEGNGLGLALVKKVIDVLGGEISVKSELGVGSTFTIILKGVLVVETS